MSLSLYLSIDIEAPPDISARRWSDFSKSGMAAVGHLWEDKFVAGHFKLGARAKYGYKRRAPDTEAKKKKLAAHGKVKKGGRVDLVWTGNLARQMSRPGFLRVFPTRLTLRKPAGTYVTDRPRGGRPNLVREIIAVVPAEDKAMSQAYKEKTLAAYGKFKERRKVKI